MSVLHTYEAVKLGTRPSSDTVFPCLMNKKMSETVDNQPFFIFFKFYTFLANKIFAINIHCTGKKV